MEEMGQTGAGLTSADMILAGTEIASKWSMLAIFYFPLQVLILTCRYHQEKGPMVL